ncbi:hypothetical protein HDU91_001176 [Kappamyces sp. JEL0680]|nr:hypothetical protein HDU91_001176 [Kappamyces sp. JEL0680]
MELKIKTSNEATFSITATESSTVLDLKTKITAHYNGDTAPQDQRLIFAGKVLKDEDTLETYKLKDGNTIHLVRGNKPKQAAPASSAAPAPAAAPASSPAPAAQQPVPNMFGTPSGMPPLNAFTGGPGFGFPQGMPGMGQGAAPGMGDMGSMMNNPMFSTMMSQMLSNPQMLDMAIQSNPHLAAAITPEVRAQMQSPEFRQMMSNPQVIQQMMQMQQMMGGMGGMGAGFNPLANMYGQGGIPGTSPGTGSPATPAAPSQPPEELYSTQLAQLRDMGFFSQQENIRALQLTGGNVEAAVEWLFSRPPGSM